MADGLESAARPAPKPLLLILLQIEAWLVCVFMFLKYVVWKQFTCAGVDFPKHYHAAIEVLHGRSPFTGDLYLGFNYPVFTASLYAFLAPFSLQGAEVLWDLCNTIYVAATIGLVIAFYRPRPSPSSSIAQTWAVRHWPVVAAFALAIFAPIFLEIHDGNIEPLNLFLLAALGAALLRGRDTLAGALLAGLCLVKILPALFLPPLFIARRKRPVIVCTILLATYALVLLTTGWWRWDWFLFTRVLPNVGFRYCGLSNSLAAIAGHYLFHPLLSSKNAFDAAAVAIACAVLAAQALVMALAWPLARRSWRPSLALTSLSLVLLSPLLEYQHLIWAIPAYLFLILDALEGRVSPRFFMAASALWIAIFACRYQSDLAVWLFLPPLHASTLLVLVLWIATAGNIVIRSRKAVPD